MNLKNTRKFMVDLEPIGRRVEVDEGLTILEAAQMAGIDLVAACGGVGICGTCLVRQMHGDFSALTQNEEDVLTDRQIEDHIRLACQVKPLGDVRVEIPPESLVATQKMQVEGEYIAMQMNPAVIPLDLVVASPGLHDLRSDLTRVNEALNDSGFLPIHAGVNGVSLLSENLRKNDWSVRLAISSNCNKTRLISTFPPGERLLGIASDMGSTKLAVFLIDLVTGATLAQAGVMNPQISYGEDVVSRIAYANRNPENRKTLQRRLIETYNQVIEQLCEKVGVSPKQVVDAVFVGNTAMHHFFCGLPVAQLGEAPYVPSASEAIDFRASEIGLNIADNAWVFVPPNIAGYVGGDHTAVLLATQVYTTDKTIVMVDIGTNTEISIVHGGRVLSCSTASGPAFEGAHIHDGMRASDGAIESVLITKDDIIPNTIGNVPPIGICGTGILKGIAELVNVGALDERGVFMKTDSRVRSVDKRAEFLLVEASKTGHGKDIVITRKDVNEIQLAKGAIRAGIEILIRESGITADDVDEWVIAGAFGTYLDLKSAVRIGMFPAVPLERYKQVGNAAGVGARQMLLSQHKREEANRVVEGVGYIELTTYSNFTETYTDSMFFNISS